MTNWIGKFHHVFIYTFANSFFDVVIQKEKTQKI